MTIRTKILTNTLILSLTAFAGSANAQISEASSVSSTLSNDWTLKETPVQNQSPFLKLGNEAEINLLTPLPSRNSELMTKIDETAYSKHDYRNFNYPLLGPVNFSVEPDYQQVFIPHNTVHTNKIVYDAPDSGPYSQTPYRVATTAAAQIKFVF